MQHIRFADATFMHDGQSIVYWRNRDLTETTPLLMLHGWGANSSLMLPLAEKLAARGHTLLVPDLPGFGASALLSRSWGVREYAEGALALLDSHHIERAHLFGHSFGGRLSLYLGAEHPDRVGKIALANSAGVPPKRSPSAQARLSLYKGVRRGLEALGLRDLSGRLRAWYSDRYGSADLKVVDGVLRETLIRVVNEDLRPYAARIKAPTLLFWGDRDEATPLWQGRVLEQLIADAALILFEGAGHYSYLDRLEETTRILDHFLQQAAE